MIKIGQKFNNWVLICNEIIKDKHYNKYVLCWDEDYNIIQYVRLENLKNGKSKGSRIRHVKEKLGNGKKWLWSTGNKYNCPMYVTKYNNPKSKDNYRIVKKDLNNKVQTIGYFRTKELAIKFKEIMEEL